MNSFQNFTVELNYVWWTESTEIQPLQFMWKSLKHSIVTLFLMNKFPLHSSLYKLATNVIHPN